MCNQMVTSEIRESFLARFVGFGQNASEIVPSFHKYTIWLPINIMGDELRWQSWIFDMFILDRIDWELHSLKCLDLKFGL